MRTMVIAGKAGEAILMVQPDWIFAMSALDITYRTYVGTDAALHATVFLYVETLVGDEYILEETTYTLVKNHGIGPLTNRLMPSLRSKISSQTTASSCAAFSFFRISRSFGSTSMNGRPMYDSGMMRE